MILWISKVVKSATISFLCVFWISSLAIAQTHPTIRSGRPGQAIGPFTVGNGLLQLQSGIDYSSASDLLESRQTTWNNVVRWGFSETFEWSLVFDTTDIGTGKGLPSQNRSGVSQFQLGFRSNVIDRPDGWIPGLGLQLRFKTGWAQNDFRARNLAPVFLAVTHHRLSDAVGWTHNLGAQWDGASPEVRYNYISNLSFSLTPSWGGFVEVFGNEKTGQRRAFGDFGAAYLWSEDLQLDLSAGWGQNYGVTETFASLGVSWRRQTLRHKSPTPVVALD